MGTQIPVAAPGYPGSPLYSGQRGVIFLGDVIEHFEKDEGIRVLERSIELARQAVIIVTPRRQTPQGDSCGNPLERHRSHWTSADFQAYERAQVVALEGDLLLAVIRKPGIGSLSLAAPPISALRRWVGRNLRRVLVEASFALESEIIGMAITRSATLANGQADLVSDLRITSGDRTVSWEAVPGGDWKLSDVNAGDIVTVLDEFEFVMAIGSDLGAHKQLFIDSMSPLLPAFVETFGGLPARTRYLMVVNRGSRSDGGAFTGSYSMLIKGPIDMTSGVIWLGL